MSAKKRSKKESATVVVIRRGLVRRMKALAIERDRLRDLARDANELADTAEEARDGLEGAIEALSRYV